MKKKNILLVVSCLLSLTVIIMLGIYLNEICIYSNYLTTDAIVIGIKSVSGTFSSDSQNQCHFVTYKYTIQGQEYITEKQVLVKMIHSEGEKEKIRYNPQNPFEIEDTFRRNQILLFFFYFGVCACLAWILTIKNIKRY